MGESEGKRERERGMERERGWGRVRERGKRRVKESWKRKVDINNFRESEMEINHKNRKETIAYLI